MKTRTIGLIAFVAVALFGLSACGGGKSSNSNATNATRSEISAAPAMQGGASNATVPNCGSTQAVWVNLKTRVYHEPGDPVYGKTRHGEYLCPSQAAAQGFRPAGGARMERGRRHRHKAAGESAP